MPNFRTHAPKRTCKKTYVNYRTYKRWLVVDFNNRCGYCNASDEWLGGFRLFHIDHFVPETKFPALRNDYSNLIYACPSCNGSKSDSWPSDDPTINIVSNKGFLHPVAVDFNLHFKRDELGNIISITDIAEDMMSSLNLGLPRHSALWMLCKLKTSIEEYESALASPSLRAIDRREIEAAQLLLFKIQKSYWDRLKVINS